ncbi:unnamed protein product [Rotaria socialis]|uniref:Uncharacterized protein n=1 Tax=Rotaria socialis TaxID=392032 RepID=A0A821YHS7_9BILA|nr:unnamed protein product [Rotaria socialis]
MDVDVQDALELVNQNHQLYLIRRKKMSAISITSSRLNILTTYDAMRVKYQIYADRYDEFYGKLVRPKLVDFLADERKRHRKSTSTQSSISLSGS